MSAVYFVLGSIAFLGALHIIRTNDEIDLSKRSSASAYEDTLARLGHRNVEPSDFDDRIENENDLSFKINDVLDKVIELGNKLEACYCRQRMNIRNLKFL